MTDAQKTIKFLAAIPAATKALILNNIAQHYGITSAAAYDEVTDDEAESLLDYVTGAERAATSLLMKRHRLA
jgi:DNA-binding transcriptional ArsR family regulator